MVDLSPPAATGLLTVSMFMARSADRHWTEKWGFWLLVVVWGDLFSLEKKKQKNNHIKAIGSSVQQSKRAHQPAIKPFWPTDSEWEEQKCQYQVPKSQKHSCRDTRKLFDLVKIKVTSQAPAANPHPSHTCPYTVAASDQSEPVCARDFSPNRRICCCCTSADERLILLSRENNYTAGCWLRLSNVSPKFHQFHSERWW